MTLLVKDANAASVALKSTTDTGEEIPHHIVESGEITLAAGTALAGAVRNFRETEIVYLAGVAHTVKRALFDSLVSTTVIEAVPVKRFRILALHWNYAFDSALHASLSTIQFTSSAAPVLAPRYVSSATEQDEGTLPLNYHGWGESLVANVALIVVVPSFTGTKAVTGEITYIEGT